MIPSSFSTAPKTPLTGRFSLRPFFSWLALALLAFAWLTTEHIPPWVSWHSEVAAFAGIWLIAIAAVATDLRLRGGAASAVALPRPTILLLALGGIALLQVLAGRAAYFGDALVVCFYVLLAVACLALGYHATQSRPFQDHQPAGPVLWLAWTLLAGACASTVIALAQVFDLWIDTGWVVVMPELRRPGANLAQPNQLATLLLMGLASLLLLAQARKLRGFAVVALLAFLSLGVAMTESRAGFVSFFVVLAWWFARRSQVFPQAHPAAGAAAGICLAALFIAWPYLLDAAGLLAASPSSRFGHPGLRLSLWQQMLEAALQKPWLGWGVLDVAEAHNAVADRYSRSDALSYSHNLLLDLMVWFGLPAAALFSVVAGVWAVRRMADARDLQSWYCVAVALPLAVHAMLEFPYAYAYLLAPVAFLLGALEGGRGAAPWWRLHPVPALLALLLTGALLLWSVVEYIAIEDDFRVVRFEQLNIGQRPPGHEAPQVRLLTQLGAVLTGSRIQLVPHMDPQNLARLEALALRYPWLATQYRYAVALALNGQPEEAIRQLQVIRVLRGEAIYQRVRTQFMELRPTHPELQRLTLP